MLIRRRILYFTNIVKGERYPLGAKNSQEDIRTAAYSLQI